MEIFLKSNRKGARSLGDGHMRTTLAGESEVLSSIGFHPMHPLQVVLQIFVRHSLCPWMNTQHIKICLERKRPAHQKYIFRYLDLCVISR